MNSNVKRWFLSLFVGLCDSEDHSSSSLAISIHLFSVCMCPSVCALGWEAHILMAHLWRSEDNFDRYSRVLHL